MHTRHKRTISSDRGFSIIEVLIASTIGLMLIPALSSAMLSSQSAVAAGQAEREAVAQAQLMLEDAEAFAREDFGLVASATSTQVTGGRIYQQALQATLLPDLLTKRVTARISWNGDHGQSLSLALTTLITDIVHADSPRACSSEADNPYGWKSPLSNSVAVGSDPSVGYPITDIAVFNGTLYVTVNTSHGAADEDLFAYDISKDPKHPALLMSTTTGPGLSAIRLARYAASGKTYAYLANTSTTAQMQVIEVTDPAHPRFVAGVRLPGNTGVGNALAYERGMIYLGLTSSGGTGSEFNVIDVHDPDSPVWRGGYSTNRHDINALVVQNGYAYLAKPTDSSDLPSEQITVLDVNDPAHLARVGGWKAPHLSGNGKSLFALGNKLFSGRTVTATDPEFSILDASDPAHLQSNNPAPPSKEVSDTINSLFIRGHLAFLVTDRQLQIWDISDTSSMKLWGQADLAAGSNIAASCMGDYLYLGSEGAAGSGTLSVLYPQS